MKKTIALLFAGLIAFVPLSAQATSQNPPITISSFEDWLKAGVDNGWVIDNKIIEQGKIGVDQAKPQVDTEQPKTQTEVRTVETKSAETKALVIIDSYFDSKVLSDNVSCVVLETKLPCTDVVTKKETSLAGEINHGNAMVEVAKKQSQGIKIIALRSGNASINSVSGVTPAQFISALKWVESNADKIGAVSFSRYFNHPSKPCAPTATSAFTPEAADSEIRKLVASLGTKGIPVFAATGNNSKKAVDYPACILEVNSVSVGSINKFGALAPGGANDTGTDFFAPLGATLTYNSLLLGKINNTTSSATAAAASIWITGKLNSKFFSVIN
jgi:hypothetical protein